jgi:hypothetical protein
MIIHFSSSFGKRLKIHKLTAAYGKSIYSACIEGNTVWSVDIGSHAIYRG